MRDRLPGRTPESLPPLAQICLLPPATEGRTISGGAGWYLSLPTLHVVRPDDWSENEQVLRKGLHGSQKEVLAAGLCEAGWGSRRGGGSAYHTSLPGWPLEEDSRRPLMSIAQSETQVTTVRKHRDGHEVALSIGLTSQASRLRQFRLDM